ncbi:MAG: cyclodeaminase/cyclohydrolase family protein [Anaerovoracaceae bacterium]
MDAQHRRDTEAFSKVSAAMKLPKESDEEKAVRSQAIQEATVTATEVPYKVMELCLAGRDDGQDSRQIKSQRRLGPGVAALNLLAGVKGAYLNVMINLPSLKGEGVKERFVDAGEIVETAQAIAEKIYAEVAASL